MTTYTGAKLKNNFTFATVLLLSIDLLKHNCLTASVSHVPIALSAQSVPACFSTLHHPGHPDYFRSTIKSRCGQEA